MVDEPGGATDATPPDDVASPADDAASKAARKEAKRAAKAAKREAKAAKQAAKAQQAAEKHAAKRARAVEKAAAKAAHKADAKAAKAAKKAAKADRRAATLADRSTEELIGAGELESLEDVEGKRTESKRSKPASTIRDADAAASDSLPAPATESLAEAAALVRRTREPAASRIVNRVDARPPRVRRPAAVPATPAEVPAPEPEAAPSPAPTPEFAEPASPEGEAPTETVDLQEAEADVEAATPDTPPVEAAVVQADEAAEAAAPEVEAAAPEVEAAAPEVETAAPEVEAAAPEVEAAAPEPAAPEGPVEPEAETRREAPGPVEAAAEPESAVREAVERDLEVTSLAAVPQPIDAIEPEPEAPGQPDQGETETTEPEAREAAADEPQAPEAVDVEPQPEAEPDAIEPDAIEPDAIVPEPVETEAIEAEPVEPEAASPEPEAASPEHEAAPELPVEHARVDAEAAEPDAVEPDAIEPDAFVAAPAPAEPEADLDAPPSTELGLAPELHPAGPHAVDVASVADGAVIGASIDIGANSVHLLVAAVAGHRVEPLLDESVFLGLGDRVARDGKLGLEARRDVVNALASYAATASRLGAKDLTIVGTEPIRRAFDATALVGEAESRADISLHVLDHDEEAMLTLLGVTKGRRVRTEVLIVDIGGGSCEFVIAGPDRPVRSVGLSLGSARLTQDHIHSDPPTPAEVDALREIARAALVDAPDASPQEMIAVGGTASNLLRLLPATAIDRVLTRRRIAVALAMLTVERSVEAAERHALRPQRARILPAGAVIVDAILERYGVDRLQVSEEGIREGAVLAAATAGPAWRDRLPFLVAGWDEHPIPD